MGDYNPANIPYGHESDLTIGGVTYVPEASDLKYPSSDISRKDKKGKPASFLLRDDIITGTVTLQLETASTAIPTTGDTFTYDFGKGTKTFVITNVGTPKGQNMDWKVSIDIRQAEPHV
jgi:hypothetical protein